MVFLLSQMYPIASRDFIQMLILNLRQNTFPFRHKIPIYFSYHAHLRMFFSCVIFFQYNHNEGSLYCHSHCDICSIFDLGYNILTLQARMGPGQRNRYRESVQGIATGNRYRESVQGIATGCTVLGSNLDWVNNPSLLHNCPHGF